MPAAGCLCLPGVVPYRFANGSQSPEIAAAGLSAVCCETDVLQEIGAMANGNGTMLPLKLRMVLLANVGLVAPLITKPLFAQGEDYIYCWSERWDQNAHYYSAVFVGDSLKLGQYRFDFDEYLQSQNPDKSFYESLCFDERTREEAESELLRDVNDVEEAVLTNWTPVVESGLSDSDWFGAQPIRDFRILVPSTPYLVEVCVRDHECEDGDRVRVSVNGSELLNVEILNEWKCRFVPLREGQHDIELYAVNGTGYKGTCSHRDENTGELRVTGSDSRTQSWRHRGGAGSSANIVVKVD